MSQPRKTYLTLLWGNDGEDISSDILPDLENFSYTDKDGDEADEISLDLKDETGKWADSWTPEANMKIMAKLATGTTLLKGVELDCGTFYVDEIGYSGPPKKCNLHAVSIPLNMDIRRKSKSKAWENKKFSEIAKELADNAELDFLFDSEDDPTFDRIDQSGEPDLRFLKRIGEDYGLSVKVTDNKLVVFNKEEYEKKDPSNTFIMGVSELLSWSFSQSHSETYKSVTCEYFDVKQKVSTEAGGYQIYNIQGEKNTQQKTTNKALMTYTAKNEDVGDDGQEFKIKKRCSSQSQAKELAEAKLRELNSKSITGSIEIVGNPLLCAGMVVALSGFGGFDGNFYVDTAQHSVSSSGYKTRLEIHKVI